jgi:hypothetical protein
MDYRSNIDRMDYAGSGLSYNQLLDVWFNEDSGAPVEPVTLSEAKLFCRIDVSDDDATIESLITTARQMCEDFTNIGFISRNVVAIINNGNGGSYLPYGPIWDIISVTDVKGTLITAEIQGVVWKQVLTPRSERLTIEYNAGHETLPAKLKTAMLNAIMYLYDNRSQGTETIGPIATMLLTPIRRIW